MIKLIDWITSSGKYSDRAKSSELTDEVQKNAQILLENVNKLLSDVGILECKISSGFRPSTINNKTPNAAKKSLHMSGKAIDILDINQKIAHKILKNPKLLKKYNLWMEDPVYTPSWCHLDIGNRSERPLRIFKP